MCFTPIPPPTPAEGISVRIQSAGHRPSISGANSVTLIVSVITRSTIYDQRPPFLHQSDPFPHQAQIPTPANLPRTLQALLQSFVPVLPTSLSKQVTSHSPTKLIPPRKTTNQNPSGFSTADQYHFAPQHSWQRSREHGQHPTMFPPCCE